MPRPFPRPAEHRTTIRLRFRHWLRGAAPTDDCVHGIGPVSGNALIVGYDGAGSTALAGAAGRSIFRRKLEYVAATCRIIARISRDAFLHCISIVASRVATECLPP